MIKNAQCDMRSFKRIQTAKVFVDQLKTCTLNSRSIMKLLMTLMQENNRIGGRPLRLHCDNYFLDGQL